MIEKDPDTGEEKDAMEELRDQFWWVEIMEGNPRWPVRCIICDVKIAANVKQIRSHDE